MSLAISRPFSVEMPSLILTSWRKVPLAAASLGQVHEARGHDGRDYAVTVQYPGFVGTISGGINLPTDVISSRTTLAAIRRKAEQRRDAEATPSAS